MTMKIIPLVAGLFKCNASNICAVFYQISTDSASRGPSATAGLLVHICEQSDITDRHTVALIAMPL